MANICKICGNEKGHYEKCGCIEKLMQERADKIEKHVILQISSEIEGEFDKFPDAKTARYALDTYYNIVCDNGKMAQKNTIETMVLCNSGVVKDEIARQVGKILEKELGRYPTVHEIAKGMKTIYEELRNNGRW